MENEDKVIGEVKVEEKKEVTEVKVEEKKTEKVEVAETKKPEKGGAIEVVEETEVFTYLDNLDQKSIIDDIKGVSKDLAWVYAFKDKKGKDHYDLTKDGIDECMRQLTAAQKAFTRETIQVLSNDDREVLFSTKVERWALDPDGREHLLDSRIGLKRQSKMKWSKEKNRMVIDPFWFEAGGQKALRNANKRLIPTEMKMGLIEDAVKQNKVFYLNVAYKKDAKPVEGAEVGESKVKKLPSNKEPVSEETGYKLSPKQQKMIWAIVRDKKIDKDKFEEYVKKICNMDTMAIYPNRDIFQEVLEILKDFKSIEEFNSLYESAMK